MTNMGKIFCEQSDEEQNNSKRKINDVLRQDILLLPSLANPQLVLDTELLRQARKDRRKINVYGQASVSILTQDHRYHSTIDYRHEHECCQARYGGDIVVNGKILTSSLKRPYHIEDKHL
jgi:hypothetical protein